MSNGSEVMIYLTFLLSEFIATRRARLEAREAGFLVHTNSYRNSNFVSCPIRNFLFRKESLQKSSFKGIERYQKPSRHIKSLQKAIESHRMLFKDIQRRPKTCKDIKTHQNTSKHIKTH